jgi:hypothetical protein
MSGGTDRARDSLCSVSLARNLDLRENWLGGFYELAICLGPPDDDRLSASLLYVWGAAGVRGCYERSADRHLPVECNLQTLEQHGHLAGIVRLPDGGEVVCGVTVVHEAEGNDWLDFYLPLVRRSRRTRSSGRRLPVRG